MVSASYSFLFLVGLVVIGFVLALFYTAAMARRHALFSDRKTCKHCQGVWNATAKFCGKCGRAL